MAHQTSDGALKQSDENVKLEHRATITELTPMCLPRRWGLGITCPWAKKHVDADELVQVQQQWHKQCQKATANQAVHSPHYN